MRLSRVVTTAVALATASMAWTVGPAPAMPAPALESLREHPQAAPTQDGDSIPPLLRSGERRVSIDVVGASAVDVFTSFAKVLGVDAQVDPKLSGRLDLRVDRVTVLTAIRAACESLDCAWELVAEPAPGLLVVRPLGNQSPPSARGTLDQLAKLAERHPPMRDLVSLDFEKTPLAGVLEMFAQLMQATIEMEPGLEDVRVSITAADSPHWRVLHATCTGARLRIEVVSEDPLVLRVVRDPVLAASPG